MFFVLALTACTTEPMGCTDLYAYSVTATVTSTSGEALSGVAGTYTVDGGAEQACEPWVSGDVLVCGGETAGHFVVTVTAEGHEPATQEVDVEADECHVIGEALEVALEPTVPDCTTEEVPSVEVRLSSDGGGPLTNAWAGWGDPAADMEPVLCDPAGEENVFHCAYEREGDIEIVAGADNHATEFAVVTVTADECHVITETVAIELSEYDCLQ